MGGQMQIFIIYTYGSKADRERMALGGCPRSGIVARACWFELDVSIV